MLDFSATCLLEISMLLENDQLALFGQGNQYDRNFNGLCIRSSRLDFVSYHRLVIAGHGGRYSMFQKSADAFESH